MTGIWFGCNARPLDTLTGFSGLPSSVSQLDMGAWGLEFQGFKSDRGRGEEDSSVRRSSEQRREAQRAPGRSPGPQEKPRSWHVRHSDSQGCRVRAGHWGNAERIEGGPPQRPCLSPATCARKGQGRTPLSGNLGQNCQLQAATVGGVLLGRYPKERCHEPHQPREQPWGTGLATVLMYKLGSLCHTPKGEKFPSSNVKLKIRHYMGASGSVKSAD